MSMECDGRGVYLIYAETQLHAGRGAELGVVDLPIQRERTTGFPIIQGIKGALRAFVRNKDTNLELTLFGSKPSSGESESTTPGSVAFSEAKILLFPVRNNEKLFVWVTCPLVLSRFLNIAKDEEAQKAVEGLDLDKDEAIALFETSNNEIWLEEIAVSKKEADIEQLKKLFEKISKRAPITQLKERLKKNIVIVSDELFSKIVETMTEVVPRVRIDEEKGTVKDRGLWYEEYLPQDTVMYFSVKPISTAPENDVLKELKKTINDKLVNIGGKETVGKGLVWIKAWE